MNEQLDKSAGENSTRLQKNSHCGNVWNYCRKRYPRLFGIALLSGVVSLLLFWIMTDFANTNSYQLRHVITLPREGQKMIYPNGKVFHPSDLLSPQVLEQVYRRLNLQDDLKFSAFYSSLTIVRDEKRLAKINAEYAKKFSMRNLKLADVAQLESAYKAELQTKPNALLTISFEPPNSSWMSERRAARILYAVAETWSDIYSRLEAAPFPQMESAARMRQVQAEVGKPSYLIPLEKERAFCNSMLNMCGQLEDLLEKKNVTLPSGESLEDIREQIASLKRYQIDLYLHYVARHQELHAPFDHVFWMGSLEQIDNRLMQTDAKGLGITQTLTAVSSRSIIDKAVSTAKSAESAAVTLQLDNSFFNSISALIRNDINAELRAQYAVRMMQNRIAGARLKAEQQYYQQMLGEIDGPAQSVGAVSGNIPPEQLTKLIRTSFDDMLKLNDKILQFRDLVMVYGLSADRFYAVSPAVQVIATPRFPVKTCMYCFAALWLLGNAAAVFIDYLMLKNKTKKQH